MPSRAHLQCNDAVDPLFGAVLPLSVPSRAHPQCNDGTSTAIEHNDGGTFQCPLGLIPSVMRHCRSSSRTM